MDLLDALRTTFSCREFTDEPVPYAALLRILDAGYRAAIDPNPYA